MRSPCPAPFLLLLPKVRAGSDASLELTLIPNEPHRDNQRKFVDETTDQNGKFTIAGIEPSDYKLFSGDIANDEDQPWPWFELSGSSLSRPTAYPSISKNPIAKPFN